MAKVEDGATSSSTPRPSIRIACHRDTFAWSNLRSTLPRRRVGGRRPGLANTPAYAVDNLRFYDRQQAYVSTRSRSAHKTRIDTFANNYAQKGTSRDAIA